MKLKTVTVRSECHTYQGEWIPERESLSQTLAYLRHYVNKRGIYTAKWGRKAKGEEDLMACRAEWEHWKTKHEP